jgi:hypothetical protein
MIIVNLFKAYLQELLVLSAVVFMLALVIASAPLVGTGN